jgi:hypothetical protein
MSDDSFVIGGHGGDDGIAIRAKPVSQSRLGRPAKGILNNLSDCRDVGWRFATDERWRASCRIRRQAQRDAGGFFSAALSGSGILLRPLG